MRTAWDQRLLWWFHRRLIQLRDALDKLTNRVAVLAVTRRLNR